MAEERAALPALSEWLQLMLAEIARKREEFERAQSEEARRELERAPQQSRGRAASDAAPAYTAPGDHPGRR